MLTRVGGVTRHGGEGVGGGAAPGGRSGHSGLLLEGGHKVVQRQAHGVPLQRRGAAERRVGRGHLPAGRERISHPGTQICAAGRSHMQHA